MYAEVRHLVLATIFALIAAWASPAAAWIELNPKGLLSTVEVEKDGRATVSHELSLELRGGPLKQLDLGTSDADAEVLPDATVTRVSSGLTVPLLVERRADGSLRLEVDQPKGLRSGTYLFKVRYHTNLVARDLVRRRAQTLEIGWVGPRLEAGIDGARAVFRLPPSDLAPRLPVVSGDDPDPGFGVMVAAVHHTPQADEIELVRSHVAKGEPVLWRIEASGAVIDAAPTAAAAAVPAVAAKSSVASTAPVGAPPRRTRWPLTTGIFGLILAVFAGAKGRALARATKARHAKPRPFVPLPLGVRAVLAGTVLGYGLYYGGELEEPTLAAAAILAAMALVIERSPLGERQLRGPGRWLSLRDEDAFAVKPVRRPGSWFDAGTLRGVLLLAAMLAAVTTVALGELGRSPYHALLLALAAASAMPVFFTGHASARAGDRVQFSHRFMRDLARSLRRSNAAKVVAWGRVPDGQGDPDELRVLIQPKDGAAGLVALETGLDAQRGLGGVVGVPFVIVRAKEGSPAQSLLPRGVVWTRGRKADERVAILSPKLPTLGLTVALVERLIDAVTSQPPKSRRMSSGRAAFTAKPVVVRSPAHAT